MLEQLRLILHALPWTGPAIIVGAVLGLLSMLLFPRRRSRSDRFGFGLFVWCLTVALVVTLSPVKNNYFGIPTTGCNWEVWRPLAHQYWFSAGSRPPNVWLLLPAGIGVMLFDGFWRRFLGIAALVALPPGVEALQDQYPELKRSCSSQDVVDNWTGLALGLAIGLVLALLIGVVRWIRRRTGRQDEMRAAALDDDGRLPLGGGGAPQQYDDFADFDDTPRSTRWYEQERAGGHGGEGVGATGVRAGRAGRAYDPLDHTPTDGLGSLPPTSRQNVRGRPHDLDDDPTPVIRSSRRNRGGRA